MPEYPTDAHARAADEITRFFAARPEIDAVLLVNSCARGLATPDSCLDLLVLGDPALEPAWEAFAAESDAVAELARTGRWAEVHLDVDRCDFEPEPFSGGTFDAFDWLELRVGNAVAYSQPLFERGDRYRRLRERWLPFYGESLRAERLPAACRFVDGRLDRIPWYVERGLWFQALDSLHWAVRGFLRALHVERRVYPISYDKWIEEQVAGNLGLPELYERLPGLFEIAELRSDELVRKASALRALTDAYLPVESRP